MEWQQISYSPFPIAILERNGLKPDAVGRNPVKTRAGWLGLISLPGLKLEVPIMSIRAQKNTIIHFNTRDHMQRPKRKLLGHRKGMGSIRA